MTASTRRIAAATVLLAVTLAAGVQPAGAACVISGPSAVCPGSSIDLCGPVRDNALYIWQAPDQSYYLSQCITVTTPGTYTLMIEDMFTGVYTDTCTATIVGATAAPTITGPLSTCTGTP